VEAVEEGKRLGEFEAESAEVYSCHLLCPGIYINAFISHTFSCKPGRGTWVSWGAEPGGAAHCSILYLVVLVHHGLHFLGIHFKIHKYLLPYISCYIHMTHFYWLVHGFWTLVLAILACSFSTWFSPLGKLTIQLTVPS